MMSNWIRIPLKIILFPVFLVINLFLFYFKWLIELGTGIMCLFSFLWLFFMFAYRYDTGEWLNGGWFMFILVSPIGLPLVINGLILFLEYISEKISDI